MIDLPCPSCGFLTLEDFYGSYAICPLCNWEDDGVQLANPTSAGGANGESLAQAQQNALSSFPPGVEVASGFRRGSSWRPLSSTEIGHYEALRVAITGTARVSCTRGRLTGRGWTFSRSEAT
ncbi:CPCC family cysteine-rich protein [Stenotrophomonas maltophilia]|uniref:CPCC family cysteine-rich protein n=1 Tax=Stenotrophomonas maltophilia TaxID=40324 RepID=UPI0021592F04|nr:CPCC family cysteine-rich protein [Stenotrophomonas maltophilia]